jgi:predicted transcriptional regulator
MSNTDLYRHYDAAGNLLYVGISKSTLTRLGQHQSNAHWYNAIAKVEIEKFQSRQEALDAERSAIIRENPAHNTLHSVENKKSNILDFIIDNIDLKPASIKLFLTIIKLSNSKGELVASYRQLAELISMSSKTVERSVKHLINNGVMTSRRNSSGTTTYYVSPEFLNFKGLTKQSRFE